MRRIIGLWIGILGVSVLGCGMSDLICQRNREIKGCVKCSSDQECNGGNDEVGRVCYDDGVCGDDCRVKENVCSEKQTCNERGMCELKSCLDYPDVCEVGEKCDDGECVKKICKDDPDICEKNERCNDDGVCVRKSCLEDPDVCYASEKCDEAGNCIKKSCKEFPEVCMPTQRCNDEGKCIRIRCKDNPDICFDSEKCNDDGVCERKTCKDDPNICLPTEKCNDEGECVAKNCKDEPQICLPSQRCNDDGECVAKNCKDDPGVCLPTEKCNDEGACVKKSCKDEPMICLPTEKCNDDGECVKKTCKDDPTICVVGMSCGDDGKCVNTCSLCSSLEVCKSGVCARKSCTENEVLCGEDSSCQDGDCIQEDGNKIALCDDWSVNYFWNDHFGLIDKILNFTEENVCDIYKDVQVVFAKDGTQLCNREALCRDPEVLFKCIPYYLTDLALKKIPVPGGYDNEIDVNDITKFGIYRKKIVQCEDAPNCTEKPSVCSEYQQCNVDGKCVMLPCRLKPEICGAHYQCIDDVCVRNTCDMDAAMCGNAYCHAKSKECYQKSCEDEADEDTCSSHIAYCGNKLVTELFYSHYRYIADIASGDRAKRCKAFSDLEKLFANEGKAICHKIDYCSSGSSTSYFRCLADYVTDIYLGKVTPPEAYKDVSITMSVGNMIVNYYLNPESICGGN